MGNKLKLTSKLSWRRTRNVNRTPRSKAQFQFFEAHINAWCFWPSRCNRSSSVKPSSISLFWAFSKSLKTKLEAAIILWMDWECRVARFSFHNINFVMSCIRSPWFRRQEGKLQSDIYSLHFFPLCSCKFSVLIRR